MRRHADQILKTFLLDLHHSAWKVAATESSERHVVYLPADESEVTEPVITATQCWVILLAVDAVDHRMMN